MYKDTLKEKTSAFYKTMLSKHNLSCEHGDGCNELQEAFQIVFLQNCSSSLEEAVDFVSVIQVS